MYDDPRSEKLKNSKHQLRSILVCHQSSRSLRRILFTKLEKTSQQNNRPLPPYRSMLLRPYFLCVAVTLQIHYATISSAFSLSTQRSRYSFCSSVTALRMHSEDNFFDIEAARRQLESLVAGGAGLPENREEENVDGTISSPVSLFTPSESSSSLPMPEMPSLDVKIPPRPPLTTIERERRLAEIELLGHLMDGNEVMPEIQNLWFSERGLKAAAVLHKANDLMEQGPEDQREAELLLRSLIEEYGVYFTEPVNRLATLYYLHGRLEESLTLNKMVLAIKPWHVDALSHIVMVYAAMGDSDRARQWAAFRLPNFTSSTNGSNRRRTRWIERAVVDATIMLHKGEKITANSFGEPDKAWVEKHRSTYDLQNPDDAWQ